MNAPPLRFAAGSDAVELVLTKAESLRAGVLELNDLSTSTDSID